jgi:tRNA(Leu) C34 or U34 (ribose-2'-O)-methylase TrmL
LKGTSTLYGSDGSIKQQWVKSDVPKEQSLDAFKEAIQNITSFLPLTYDPSTTPQPDETTTDLMTIYPIGDAHVGMLAHEAETGEDHDLKISISRHIKAINLAVSKAAASAEALNKLPSIAVRL